LTAALYAETETDKYSSVVVVVKENSKFKTLQDLKGAKACFPEFGSIGNS
jgi:ABC-type phosphate/phosphonate transport system substrate-binding protein